MVSYTDPNWWSIRSSKRNFKYNTIINNKKEHEKMSTTLCGKPSCGGCPSIEENKGKGVIIRDDDQKITFTEKQLEELCKYLCKREGSACKCASCLSKL